MAQLILASTWNAYNPATSPIIDSESFREQWLWGIPLSSIDGNQLSDNAISAKLVQAQAYLEKFIGIKFSKQYVSEWQDFVNENFFNWGYIKTNFPINEPLSLTGNFNQQQIIVYPVEWLSCSKMKGEQANNNLFIVPNGQASVNVTYLSISMSQYFGFHNARIIPNYWNIGYCTGFDTVPADLIKLVCLLAAIDILLVIEMGVGVLGGGSLGNTTMFGAASNSLSIDGLSQNVSKMNGGNIFQQRIKQYFDQTRELLKQSKYIYGGIKFDVA